MDHKRTKIKPVPVTNKSCIVPKLFLCSQVTIFAKNTIYFQMLRFIKCDLCREKSILLSSFCCGTSEG
jgi:hypothetical protein